MTDAEPNRTDDKEQQSAKRGWKRRFFTIWGGQAFSLVGSALLRPDLVVDGGDRLGDGAHDRHTGLDAAHDWSGAL